MQIEHGFHSKRNYILCTKYIEIDSSTRIPSATQLAVHRKRAAPLERGQEEERIRLDCRASGSYKVIQRIHAHTHTHSEQLPRNIFRHFFSALDCCAGENVTAAANILRIQKLCGCSWVQIYKDIYNEYITENVCTVYVRAYSKSTNRTVKNENENWLQYEFSQAEWHSAFNNVGIDATYKQKK